MANYIIGDDCQWNSDDGDDKISPPSPGGGRSIGGLRPPSLYVKNADAERRLCETRWVGVKARAARCDSLRRRAPHPAHLRCATLPLQRRVKHALILATRTASEFCQAIPKKKKERQCTKHPSPNEPKTASSFVQQGEAERRQTQ